AKSPSRSVTARLRLLRAQD
ncbi:hypothetical protein D018_3477B, partial [Vibrio parahaemolyticus VP2007-007]